MRYKKNAICQYESDLMCWDMNDTQQLKQLCDISYPFYIKGNLGWAETLFKIYFFFALASYSSKKSAVTYRWRFVWIQDLEGNDFDWNFL